MKAQGRTHNVKHYLTWILAGTMIFGILASQEMVLAQDGTWVKMTDMPTARYWFSAAVVGGKIYTIGGTQDSGREIERAGLSTVEVYDPATDTWTRKTDMPTQRMGLSTSVVDGAIYAIGGRDRNTTLTTVEAYDLATDTQVAFINGQGGSEGLAIHPITNDVYTFTTISGQKDIIYRNQATLATFVNMDLYVPTTPPIRGRRSLK